MVHAGAAVSDEVQVALRQAPAFTLTSTSRGVAYLRISGGVPRAKFVIQRQSAAGAWSTVFTSNLLSTGAYNKALTGQASGRAVSYRVYMYGSSANGVEGGVQLRPPRHHPVS